MWAASVRGKVIVAGRSTRSLGCNMSRVIDTLTKLNGIGPVVLLWANVAIALLVVIAHAGCLLVVRRESAAEVAEDIGFTYITIPVAVLVLVTAVAALAKAPLRWPVLKFQSVVLVLGALSAAYLAFTSPYSVFRPDRTLVESDLLRICRRISRISDAALICARRGTAECVGRAITVVGDRAIHRN